MIETLSDTKEQKGSIGKASLAIGVTGGIIASMCCLPPLILVLLGVISVSAGIALGDYLYANYEPHVVLAGAAFILLATLSYARRRACPKDIRWRMLSGAAVVGAISYLGLTIFLTVLEVLAKRALG